MEIAIKYFDGAQPLAEIKKGNWIDVRANETVFIPLGENRNIHLGFAMQLPEGYEGYLVPRSSAYSRWGIIQGNHIGIFDTSYCGDNDEWMMNAVCVKAVTEQEFTTEIEGCTQTVKVKGTLIHKGDRIGQIRVMKSQEPIDFNQVESLGNEDRGGFGTTGAN